MAQKKPVKRKIIKTSQPKSSSPLAGLTGGLLGKVANKYPMGLFGKLLGIGDMAKTKPAKKVVKYKR